VVMGKQYSQLGIEEREMISVLRAEGKTAIGIGRVISRSHSCSRAGAQLIVYAGAAINAIALIVRGPYQL